MKIVVTGAAGKVGRYVLDELSAAQNGAHDVLVADLTEPSGRDVRFVRTDVTRLEDCQQVVAGAEAVIHLAAIPNPLNHPPEVVMQVKVMGTYHVLEAAARAGVRRVVIASTDSALGFVFRRRDFAPEYLPIDEQHPLRPQDPYGLSKQICEEMCQAYTRGWGMETVCLRICRVIFPDELDLNRSLTADPKILAKGLWVYIDARDAARVFRLAAEAPGLQHEAVFAVAPDCYGTHSTAELLDQFYPSLRVWADRVPGRSSLIAGAKAERLLGFRPKHTWRDVV